MAVTGERYYISVQEIGREFPNFLWLFMLGDKATKLILSLATTCHVSVVNEFGI